MLVQIIGYLVIFVDLYSSINFALYSSCCCCHLIFSGSKFHMCGRELVPVALELVSWSLVLARSFSSRKYLMPSIWIFHLPVDYYQCYLLCFIHVKNWFAIILDLTLQGNYLHISLNISILINCLLIHFLFHWYDGIQYEVWLNKFYETNYLLYHF